MLSLLRAPNLGISCVPRSLMPTSPLDPTEALEMPPLFSHPLASAMRPPQQLAPTVGQLEIPARVTFMTGLPSDTDEPVSLADDVIDMLAASFTAMCIFDAPAADDYPSGFLTSLTPPSPSVTVLPLGRL